MSSDRLILLAALALAMLAQAMPSGEDSDASCPSADDGLEEEDGSALLHLRMETGIAGSHLHEQTELRTDPAEDPADLSAKFSSFIQQQGRSYRADSEEYRMRLAHFQERVTAVDAHNQQAGRRWTAVVNSLADHTPEELAMLRGYRHTPKGQSAAAGGSLGLASTSVRSVDVNALPVNFTWHGRLAAMQDVRNQGSCGSCWAISSSTVLRAHAELYQQDRTFSTQQIVECTPNPQECGGKGGCQGATAELAMDYAKNVALATEEDHEYLASDMTCAQEMKPTTQISQSSAQQGVSLPEVSMTGAGGLSFGMTGWERIPENSVEPLLLAVYEKGPVVVSVAANDKWSMYGSGIMDSCDPAAVINHAVVLVGYGPEFWHIQNSWGSSWGEGGFVRMYRRTNQDEAKYCGYDATPLDGTGCKGGPAKVWICGSCGVLYDNVVPTFALSETGFLARHSRDSAGIFTQLTDTAAAPPVRSLRASLKVIAAAAV